MYSMYVEECEAGQGLSWPLRSFWGKKKRVPLTGSHPVKCALRLMSSRDDI